MPFLFTLYFRFLNIRIHFNIIFPSNSSYKYFNKYLIIRLIISLPFPSPPYRPSSLSTPTPLPNHPNTIRCQHNSPTPPLPNPPNTIRCQNTITLLPPLPKPPNTIRCQHTIPLFPPLPNPSNTIRYQHTIPLLPPLPNPPNTIRCQHNSPTPHFTQSP